MMLIVHTLVMPSMHIRFKFGTADLWWWSKCEECNLKYYCVFLPYRLFFAPGPWLWVLTSPGRTSTSVMAHTVDLFLGKRRKKKKKNYFLCLLQYFVSSLPSDQEQRWRVKGCRREQTAASAFWTFLLLLLLQHHPQSLWFAFGLSLPHLISHLKKHSYACNLESGTHLHHDAALYPCQNPD